MTVTPEQVPALVARAKQVAFENASHYYMDKLGGRDQYACGFAWVDIYGVRSNSKLGKALIAAGFRKSDYKRCLSMWNPSGMPCQNIDTKEVGAVAAANILREAGLQAYAGSRLD